MKRTLIRDGLRRGMGEVTFAQVRGNLDARLSSGEFQIVERSHNLAGPSVHHCQNHRGRTHEIVRRVREGQQPGRACFASPAGHRCCRPTFSSQPRPEECG
jgi:hypothetical protein